jgi:hypothetical protein
MATMQKFRPELNSAPGDAEVKVKVGGKLLSTAGCEYTPGGDVIISTAAVKKKAAAKPAAKKAPAKKGGKK